MANKEHHPEYGRMPGNQEPNTPGVNESEQGRRAQEGRQQQGQSHERRHDGSRQQQAQHSGSKSTQHADAHAREHDHGGHHPEWGKVPGNQEPNTPGVRESDQRKK